MGPVNIIGNSDLEACPNHVINSLDSRMVDRMSDEIVLSSLPWYSHIFG